jgi:hypothetical protein
MKVIPARTIPLLQLFPGSRIIGYHTFPEHTEYETEDEVVDVLFCGVEDKPCDITVDLTDRKDLGLVKNGPFMQNVVYTKEYPIVCDDVCELFGGPLTRREKIRTFFIRNLAIFKIFLHKIINIHYRGTVRRDGYKEYHKHLQLYIFGKRYNYYWDQYGNTEK